MPIIRTIAEKLLTRLIYRNEYESRPLRRYFRRTYGIDVGLYTIGAFDRWRIPPNSRIGRYCSIANTARLVDANHPVEALSTHPYFYLKEFGIVGSDRAKVRPPAVEDDVWLGHNSIITPGCSRIGRGAVIGAGAIVMADVEPYAIMAGAPAKLVRYRFPSQVIEAVETTEWWRFDKAELDAALAKAPGFATAPSVESAMQFLRATGRSELADQTLEKWQAARDSSSAFRPAASDEAVIELLRGEIKNFTAKDMERPIFDLEIDSFGLISLRTTLETLIGRQISDSAWGKVQTPADVVRIARASGERAAPSSAASPAMVAPRILEHQGVSKSPASERRVQDVNMPQMALSGLSEPWIFKELGDLHWSVLTAGLRTPSAAVADSEGVRLYATFTRICLSARQPLTDIKENDRITLDLEMSRFGAGMFFSSANVDGPNSHIHAEIMTSFSKFGEAGSNTSLLKGQPVIPENCDIPALSALPEFAVGYRAQRASDLPPPIFETEYEILPPHDINGVGLLYFAAYPTIIDICAARRLGPGMFSDYSTSGRDVYYFANSAPSETLIFKMYKLEDQSDVLKFEASLSRKSDGKLMAFVATVKHPVRPRVLAEAARPVAAPKAAKRSGRPVA